MRSVRIVLALALALLAVAIVVVMSRSPLVVAGTNGVQAPLYRNGTVPPAEGNCQSGGTLPRGTSVIRISMGANGDPRIAVKVYEGSRLVTQGVREAGGGLNASATVPVTPVERAIEDVRVCVTIGAGEPIGIRAVAAQPTVEGPLTLRDVSLGMEYLRPGAKSWWSHVSSIAYDFGLGRGFGGTWIAYLVLALMLAVVVLASRLTLRELR
jgi:hypothetical protein